MRKKLFAILMSVAMLVTFMPAMAFAFPTGNEPGFYVSGYGRAASGADSFTYDGIEHEVSYTLPKDDTKFNRSIYYSAFGTKADGTKWTYTYSTTVPKVKDAGEYFITAKEVYYFKEDHYIVNDNISTIPAKLQPFKINGNVYTAGEYVAKEDIPRLVEGWDEGDYPFKNYVTCVKAFEENVESLGTLKLTINQRPVNVQGYGVINKSKNYDGQPFTLSDKDFVITAVPNVAASGMIAGESLIINSYKTGVDAGIYYLTLDSKNINTNYRINNATTNQYVCTFTINKADNEIICPTSNKTVKAKKVANGPVLLAVKKSATFGTVKMTKLGGSARLTVSNGKIKVRQNTKKGTYKVKIKVYVTGNANYKSAHLTKTIKVKVK